MSLLMEKFAWDSPLQRKWTEAQHLAIFRNSEKIFTVSSHFLQELQHRLDGQVLPGLGMAP